MWTVAAVSLLLVGCTGDTAGTVPKERQRWNDQHLTSYTYVFTNGFTLCREHKTKVVVRNSQLESTTDLTPDACPVNPNPPPTIDGLFDEIRSIQQSSVPVEVTYDPSRGFPTFVSVDPMPSAVDDEYWYGVEQFSVG